MKKHVVTWTPAICEGESPAYEGNISVRMPLYDERLDFYAGAGVALDGTAGQDATRAGVLVMRHVSRQAAAFVEAVKLTRKADGATFTWDDMLVDTDMGPVIAEVCNRLLGKYSTGNLPPPS